MSFLKDIQGFSKSGLKHTCTEVTYVDGRRVREDRDHESGWIKSQVLDGGLGFVGDYKPDLQVAEILPHLYLGSQDVAADFPLLKSHNISHILNVAAALENRFPKAFEYLNLDLLDLPETHIPDSFDEAFTFINAGRERGNVFVHCNAGVSRAASIVIGYLIKTERMDFVKAYEHVKSIRPAIRPNDGFRQQLQQYKP